MRKLLLAALLSFCVSAFCGLTDPVILNVPVISNNPSVEEIASPGHGFWHSAAAMPGFTELSHGRAPRWNTEMAVSATEKYLYVQMRAATEAGVKMLAKESKRDGTVYFDNCLELALAAPGAPDGEYYQFTVNNANVVYDAHKVNAGWNSRVESAVVVEKERWILTLRIPFADMGFDGPPPRLMCNAARTTLVPEAEQSVLVRTSGGSFFGLLSKSLQLNFGRELPSGRATFMNDGDKDFVRAAGIVLPADKFADFKLELWKDKKLAYSGSGQVRFDSLQCDLAVPLLEDGNYIAELTMLQAKEYIMPAYYGGGVEANPNLKAGQAPAVYLRSRWAYKVDKAPKVKCEVTFPEEGRKMKVVLTPSAVEASEKAEYRLVMMDGTGRKQIHSFGAVPCTGEEQVVEFNVADVLPERTRMQLHTVLVDGGETLVESRTKCATASRPVWKGDRVGMPDGNKIPAPWTPVQLNGRKVQCWGRTYEFGENSPAPVQIYSQDRPLLSVPAQLVSEPAISWKLLKAVKLNEGAVRFDYAGSTGDGIKVNAFTEVYFDGSVRTDFTLPAGSSFSKLHLDLLCRREAAAFLHHGPGRFGGMFNVRTVGEAENHPIIPNMMLLNDDVGLGWFDGMPFDWPLADSEKAVQVLPEKEGVRMRINYIDNSAVYPRARTFSYGLQALPARPMPENEPGMRMSYAILYGDEEREAWLSYVDYYPHGNIDHQQGAAECKFMLTKGGQEDTVMNINHGENITVIVGVDKQGCLFARYMEWGSTYWYLGSKAKADLNRWHSAALNWGNGKLELWLDGKKVAERAYPNLMRVAPANLRVGGRNVCVDEFRISAQPRSGFTMDEPALDEATLLYDNFDQLTWKNGRRATVPARISADTECGYLLPDTSMTTGIRGKAVGPVQGKVPTVVEAYARLGFKVMCYHAANPVDDACAGLYVSDKAKFNKSRDAIQKNGMKAILYVGNGISNYDHAWDTYASQWLIEPRGVPFIPDLRPDEHGHQACPRSGYIEYFHHRIAKLMDEHKADGIFMDGRLDAQCDNPRHGCGVENFSGERVSNRDVWRARMEGWRLYNIVQERGGYCEQHKSGNWNLPTCFFWDGVWEGEQLMGVKLNGRKRLEICPLESFRGEINGIPYGMPSRNTAYTFSPLSPIENCTMSFVHGTTWTMTYRQHEGLVVSPYWLAQDAFGATLKNFVGYWADVPPAVKTPHDLVKVSAHVKPGAALIMVANFNEDAEYTAGDVQLNLKALGITAPRMRDAFSGEKISVSADGTFRINLRSFRQGWFIVEEAK